MRLGVDCELAPVPESISRQASRPSRKACGTLGDVPQRLSDSSAAQELRCLLDTRPSDPAEWHERMKVAIADTFGARPDLLETARHGLAQAASQLQLEVAAKRDAALGELDALLFALSLARSIPGAERP